MMKRPGRGCGVDAAFDRSQDRRNELPLVDQHRLGTVAQCGVRISLDDSRLRSWSRRISLRACRAAVVVFALWHRPEPAGNGSHDDPHRPPTAVRLAAQRFGGAGGEPLRRPRRGQRVERIIQTDTGWCPGQCGRNIHSGR